MKKMLTSLVLSLGLLLITSPQPVFAGTPTCDVLEQEYNGNDEIWFCTGGFNSIAQGAAHRIKFSCVENCDSLYWDNVVDYFSLTRSDLHEEDGNIFSCAVLQGVGKTIVNSAIRCVENENKPVEECVPRIEGSVRSGTIIANEWCSATIPDEFFISKVMDAVKDDLGDPLIPSPTPKPGGIETPYEGITDDTFDALNPLLIADDKPSTETDALSTPGGIISKVLDFAFPIAGLILFVMLVLGGFTMVAGATDKKAIETGKQRITSAIAGFILLFASFWIMRLIEMIFGIKIL